MRFNIVLIFVVLVFVSGCNGVTGGSNEGIRITQFGFDSSSISDKDSVELSLTLDNVGSYDSDSVNFYLYGYDVDSWESSNAGASVGTASEDSWTIDSFEGFDGDTSFPGMSGDYYQTFKLASDMLSRGVRNSYNFNGRLCYKYQTSATAMIEAISATQRRADGGTSTGTVKVTNSYGPIQVQVKSKTPLVFYDDSGTIDTELALIINNVGSGFAASDGCSLDVTVDSVNMISGLEVTLDGETLTCDDDYSLYGGQAVLYCEYSVSGSRPKGEYMLNVVVDYYYYDDVKASISVTGTSEDVEISSPSGGSGSSVGEVLKLDSCEKLCEEIGTSDSDLDGTGVCDTPVVRGDNIVEYPGENFNVIVEPVEDMSGFGNVVTGAEKYLKYLDFHDLTVDDLGIMGRNLNDIANPGMTMQYDYDDFEYDGDGDGLPDEWETLFPGMDKDNDNSDDDNTRDDKEICDSCLSNEYCDNTKTYAWNYNNECYFGDANGYYSKLDDSMNLEGSVSDAIVTTTANPQEHKITSGEDPQGMKIVAIGSKRISDMTAESNNEKIQRVKYIDVDQIELNSLGVNDADLFPKIECETGTFDEDTICMCVDRYWDTLSDSNKYTTISVSKNTDCYVKCENNDFYGGVCYNDANQGDNFCLKDNVIKFSMNLREEYCSSGFCWCYTLENELSSYEADQLCD